MKTNSETKDGWLSKLTRLPKLLVIGAIATLMAIPAADARPGRHRDRDHREHYHRHDRHRDHRHHYHHRHHHRPVHRGWSRAGWYGAYPPAGYVDYRYIHALPRGYRSVYRNGHRYYYHNGNYWWPARYNGRGVYINVRL